MNVFTFDGVELKCHCTEGSFVDGIRKSISYTFNLDKAKDFEILCEPATIDRKKLNKSTLKKHVLFRK